MGSGFHFEYGASSAKRWTSCLASTRLCAMCPPGQDSEWGEEGTIAHDLASTCLSYGLSVAELRKANAKITDEMAQSVQVYLDYIYGVLRQYPDAILRVENQVAVPSAVVPGRMGGTYDARIYIPSLGWLIVIDYKHGAGIFVSEEGNLQMEMYEIASLWEMDEPVRRVTGVIVQPRSFVAGGAVREHDIDISALIERHAWFDRKALASLDPNAPFEPTPDNCRWCPAGGYGMCPVAIKGALAVLNPEATDFGDLAVKGLPDPLKMDVNQMSYIMANEKQVLALFKNVRMTATGMARNGTDFPGWKMVLGDAERAWHGDPMNTAAILMTLLGKSLDDVMPRSLITITQAENLLVDFFRNGVTRQSGETKRAFKFRQNEAARLARETLALCTLREPRGSPRLVPLSDPRTALETSVPLLAGQINTEGL